MSYQLLSVPSVLAFINTTNGISLALADVTFGNPVATNGTWRGMSTTHNSAVKVSAVPNGKYQGSQTVTYDRLDLASLTKLPGFQIQADRPKKVSDLFLGLRYFTGIQFDANDLVDSAVTDNGNGTFSATLTAKPNSVGWIGSLAVTVKQGGAYLANAITTPELPGLSYPTPDATQTFGAIYLYPYDFTAYNSTLAPLAENTVITSAQADALVTMLKAVDISSGKTLWNNDPASTTWSLAGAKVNKNTLNGADLPTNPAYKYALSLTLRDGVTIPSGLMYLHYNDPVDPNAAS